MRRGDDFEVLAAGGGVPARPLFSPLAAGVEGDELRYRQETQGQHEEESAKAPGIINYKNNGCIREGMVLDWFFRDDFEEFYKRVERLARKVRILEKETSKKREWELEDVKEIRRHFKKIKKLLPGLSESLNREAKTIMERRDNDYTRRLKEFVLELKIKTEELENSIETAEKRVKEMLKIRKLPAVKKDIEDTKKTINYLEQLLLNTEREAITVSKLEKEFKKKLKAESKEKIKPVSKLNMRGELRNGWPLRNVRDVVVELGGSIERNKGRHPFKIVFEKKRAIPLAESTPPRALVRQLSERTGVPPPKIFKSISQGELVEN